MPTGLFHELIYRTNSNLSIPEAVYLSILALLAWFCKKNHPIIPAIYSVFLILHITLLHRAPGYDGTIKIYLRLWPSAGVWAGNLLNLILFVPFGFTAWCWKAESNLIRIDNALSNMESRLARVQDKLDTLHTQMETAKAELGKPFPQEQELKEKSARLAELNIELNIDDKTPLEAMIDASEPMQDTRPAVTVSIITSIGIPPRWTAPANSEISGAARWLFDDSAI